MKDKKSVAFPSSGDRLSVRTLVASMAKKTGKGLADSTARFNQMVHKRGWGP